MEKTGHFDGYPIKVSFDESLISIVNDHDLWSFVDRLPEETTIQLVAWIKVEYQQEWGKPLGITDDSLIVEIWGHIYFEYFLLKYRKLMRFLLAFGLYRRLRKSGERIDCGERGKDPNRRVWDRLARHKNRIAKWLPKGISTTNDTD